MAGVHCRRHNPSQIRASFDRIWHALPRIWCSGQCAVNGLGVPQLLSWPAWGAANEGWIGAHLRGSTYYYQQAGAQLGTSSGSAVLEQPW